LTTTAAGTTSRFEDATQQSLHVASSTSINDGTLADEDQPSSPPPVVLATSTMMRKSSRLQGGADQAVADEASIRHIEDEITELNHTMKKFIEEKMSERKMSMDVAIQSSSNGGAATTTGIVTENDTADVNKLNFMISVKSQRIGELELEIEALNKRIGSIESSLARWIFRACDYKADLDKAREQETGKEGDLAAAKQSLEEYEAKVARLSRELETCTAELSRYVGREVSDKQCETESVRVQSHHVQTVEVETHEADAQTDVITNTTVIPSGVVALQAAKLNTQCFNEILQKGKLIMLDYLNFVSSSTPIRPFRFCICVQNRN
jgi:predicted  nucleic acid-binding Zn-ribbon protein